MVLQYLYVRRQPQGGCRRACISTSVWAASFEATFLKAAFQSQDAGCKCVHLRRLVRNLVLVLPELAQDLSDIPISGSGGGRSPALDILAKIVHLPLGMHDSVAEVGLHVGRLGSFCQPLPLPVVAPKCF